MISDGHIQSHNFISMIEIKEKYDNERRDDPENNGSDGKESG